MAYTGVDHRVKDVVNSFPSHQVPIPTNISELLWEERDRTLSELISTYRLPLAVKLKSGDISKYFLDNVSVYNGSNCVQITESSNHVSSQSSHGTNFEKMTPSLDSTYTTSRSCPESNNNTSGQGGLSDVILQVHETRRRKIILARRMTWEKRQNDYVVSGDQVEIPASVKGWLEVVPDDGRPVEYFDTIGGIASVKPKRFLVRTSIVGYQLTTEENGNSCWMPYEIKSGEVLTAGVIYMDTKKAKNTAHRSILKRLLKQNKPKKEQDLKYLQCFNSSRYEIMIPVIMSGVFSPVGDPSVVSYDSVYELQDLIIAFGLPVNAQFIHISNKHGSICPRGVIRLYGTREEEVAIVSKVEPDGVLFSDRSSCDRFEIPVDAMLFSRGIVKKKPIIKSKLVDGFPQSYSRMINKGTPEDSELKSKNYVTAKSIDDCRLRATYDKRFYISSSEKSNSLSAIYMSKHGSTCEEQGEMKSNNTGRQTIHCIQTLATSTDLSESNTETLLNNEVSKVSDSHQSCTNEQNTKTDVELPKRATKGLKKSRSTSILDKLSVRKVKRERAKLKELRSDDVFSKRISRNDLSYQDFFTGLNNDGEEPKNGDTVKVKHDDSGRDSSGGTTQSCSSNNSSGVYSTSTPTTFAKTSARTVNDISRPVPKLRESSVQNRDLPPIPTESLNTPDAISLSSSVSVESLYEHLPPAPKPPYLRIASDSALFSDKCDIGVVKNDEKDEDDYMVPLQVHQESRYIKRSDIQHLSKIQGLPNETLGRARARRTRSELSRPTSCSYDGCQQNDSPNLFKYAYTSKTFGENHPLVVLGPYASSASQLYGTIKASSGASYITGSMGNFDERCRDSLDLDTEDTQYGSFHNSRLSKSMNCDPNAILLSPSPRTLHSSPKKVLNFTDSYYGLRGGNSLPTFIDLQNNYVQNAYDDQSAYIRNCRPQLLSSRSIDARLMSHQSQQHPHHLSYFGSGCGIHHVESEPNFHQNTHPTSPAGISDALLKQGDDSAISLCSRGEAGCPYESNYSCLEQLNNDWTPPEQLEGLSVQEVSRSLHYIGMKDRVILRFSNEQIDGSMLCSLDRKLLKEGFPELNALEIKKILDFLQGWRPKKS